MKFTKPDTTKCKNIERGNIQVLSAKYNTTQYNCNKGDSC